MVNFEHVKTVMDYDEEDRPVAYGVQLRDAKPHTTWHFVCAEKKNAHLYVYVDKDSLPVAMAWVLPTKRLSSRKGQK